MSELKTEFVTLKVSDRTEMRAYMARPERGEKLPGVLVFQEAFGIDKHIRDVTERLAKEGYLTIAPELFHRTAPPGFEGNFADFQAVRPHVMALTDANLEADLRAAHDALLRQRTIDAQRIACVGFCMGGRVSFLANLILPLRAAISFYGGGIAKSERGPGLLGRVEETKAPIFLFWGGRDRHIGPEQRNAVNEALQKAQKTFASMEFADADHAFFNDTRPSYNKAAAERAWTLSLAFFQHNLA
ncbi:MAG TPA: dienelactone hydrolase family protein [Candidatus Acidoferrales bacterium]|nr:dienelactone hydrolase family protein [Candidatus Acidoferrales bacterium]